jgi:hypothetical protein
MSLSDATRMVLMADKGQSKTYLENAPGDFYVRNDECIACRAPESVAPDLIGFYEDPAGGGARSHCYFKKQPKSPEEIERAVKAVWANCCGSYRYGGSDADVEKKLRAADCSFALDE